MGLTKVTKVMTTGLENVDNTSDLDKPISTATQTALNAKANSSHTHPLSDLTQSGASSGQVPTWNGSAWAPATPAADTGITQLTGDVTAGPGSGSQAATLATVNSNVGSFTYASLTVNAKGLITAASSGTAPITDHTGLSNIGTNTHAQIDTHIANTSNPHSVTKSQVGLGNCDNTSDANKPVSTAQQTAIDAKVSDTAYDATSWNGVTTIAPSKNAVRDYLETLIPAASTISASAIDWSTLLKTGGLYTKTLSANTTFTFSNATAGQTIVVRLTNTASNYTVTWPTVRWSGGAAPTMTTGAKSDIYTFIYDGTNYFGSAVQNMS